PGIVAPLPVDAEITLGAERGRGRPRGHVDGLLAATPQLPQLGGGEAGGGDGGLRRGGDLEDAGEDRIAALEARALEDERVAPGPAPELGECNLRRGHDTGPRRGSVGVRVRA